MNKIKTLPALMREVLKCKNKGLRIVFTNGCFDILHPGHLKILKEAKTQGDILIVGLNSDASVKKIKGPKRPILNEKARSEIVENLEIVNFVVIFDEKTPYNIIKKIKPDVLIKGADWAKEKIVGQNLVEKIYRVKICPGYSTTSIINKIKKSG